MPAGRSRGGRGRAGRLSIFTRVDAAIHRFLVERSLLLLRWSVGLIFLYFGALKLFPMQSPAESLVVQTISMVTFDLVPARLATGLTGAVECALGLMLLTGRLRRITIYVLGLELIGILAPLVLFPARLFTGLAVPTLEGQYVLKDLILAASALVLASTIRGGRLVTGPDATPTAGDPEAPDDELDDALDDELDDALDDERLGVVLASIRSGHSSTDAARAHGITPQQYRCWRDEFLDGAVASRSAAPPDGRPSGASRR